MTPLAADPVLLYVQAAQLAAVKITEREFAAFASDAGFLPGEWPFFLTVVRTEKEAATFKRGARLTDDTTHAFLGYEYAANGGTVLRIYND